MENGPAAGITRKKREYRSFIIGCSVLMVFILLLMGIMLYSFYRSPYYGQLAECRDHIRATGDALNRYARKNDVYPDKLVDLVPDYISASVLHCPSDISPKSEISYQYTKLDIDAPDKAILLTCDHHRLKTVMPGVMIHYYKDGSVGVTPAPKETE